MTIYRITFGCLLVFALSACSEGRAPLFIRWCAFEHSRRRRHDRAARCVRVLINSVFWRKFKLDWSYAIGGLFIVTLGVLVALAIGQWNSETLERRFIRGITTELQTQANDLVARLRDYQANIE